MPWLFITLSIVYLAFTIADAFGDVAIETGKQKQWHQWGAVQASAFCIVVSYAAFALSWNTIIAFIVLLIIRFPLFNLLHNLSKKQPWYYLSDHGIDGFVKMIIKWIFPIVLAAFPSAISAQHYAVMSPISDSVSDYYVFPDTAVLRHPDILRLFERDGKEATQATNGSAPCYYFIFNVNRPVKSNQLLDGNVVFAKDPEKTVVTHTCQSGTGKRYFVTDRFKGGIRVKDARTINRAPRTWTYDVYCYDATRLYCVAYCQIVVR